MTISVNCTIEELKEKATKLQNASESQEINKEYWLKELLPQESELSNTENHDPYESLTGDAYNEKFDEWFTVYENEYEKPRSKVLDHILDSYLLNNLDEDTFTSVRNLLLAYLKYDTGSITQKAGILLEKYDLEKLISESIIEIDEATDEWKIAKLFSFLNGFEYEKELSEDTVNRLVKLMIQASLKKYINMNPYFSLFNIFKKIAPKYPKLLTQMQENLVDLLNLEYLDYRNYNSALYMISSSWEQISFYWSDECKQKLIGNTIKIAEDKFKPGDSFVENGVLSALKLIGKEDKKAQEVINRMEKELEKYCAKGQE